MKKVLGWPQLISLGVGSTIGVGIFVTTGVVAATKSGPALFLCYIISAITCALAGLSYAEMAAMSPSAGSAYSYARASLGQLMGWIIGWDLCLEYAVSTASVAQGWSKYLNALLQLMGAGIPKVISQAPWDYHPETGEIVSTGAIFDLPAVVITIVITYLVVKGIKESARMADIMVIAKVVVVLFVIFVGAAYVNPENFSPFAPYGVFGLAFFGETVVGQSAPDGSPVGVFAGAAIAFFSYIGFDSVTTSAEETKNPQRDLPIGIIGSLTVSTVLYCAVSVVLVGLVPYKDISIDAPVSDAFGAVGLAWAEGIIAIGALVGITSVLLVFSLGQPRIFMAMARDGLLPRSFFASLHPVYRTPYKSSILTGIIVSFIAAFIPLSVLVELVSIGTLLAFTIVCCSIIVLRRTAPDIPRPFKCPWVPWVPGAGAAVCILLMLSLPSSNWIRLIVWLAIGMLIYLVYGRKHGRMVMAEREREARAVTQIELAEQVRAREEEDQQAMEQDGGAVGAVDVDVSRNDFVSENGARLQTNAVTSEDPNPFDSKQERDQDADHDDEEDEGTLLSPTQAESDM